MKYSALLSTLASGATLLTLTSGAPIPPDTEPFTLEVSERTADGTVSPIFDLQLVRTDDSVDVTQLVNADSESLFLMTTPEDADHTDLQKRGSGGRGSVDWTAFQYLKDFKHRSTSQQIKGVGAAIGTGIGGSIIVGGVACGVVYCVKRR